MEKKTIFAVTYASYECCDGYHHVETKICLTEDEAREEFDNCINTVMADFNEHGYDTSWFGAYKFPNFISEFCEDNETSYRIEVVKKEVEL